MLTPVPPSECMRAREAASGRLDGELSEHEAARLAGHLRDCPACSEFAEHTAAIAATLRAAPLEPLAVPAFAPRPRRRISAVRLQAAAAAVAGAALIGSSVLAHVIGRTAAPARTSALVADASSLRRDALEQRLIALVAPPRPNPSGIGVVPV